MIANDALGNFVAVTPLLQMLRSTYTGCRVTFFGGMRTLEFQAASNLFEDSQPLHGSTGRQIAGWIEQYSDSFDLVLNVEASPLTKVFAGSVAGERGFVCGPSVGTGGRGELAFAEDDRGRLWEDKEWIHPEITARFPFLNSGFIGEMFCRLAYLEGPIPRYRLPTEKPSITVPDVLIAASASLQDKLWPPEKWMRVLEGLAAEGVSAGLLGAKPSDQRALWLGAIGEEVLVRSGLLVDLRGRMTLPQVVGALGKAKAALTLDNGILHMAVAAGTRTVGLYRHGIHRLWAPPFPGLEVLTAGEGKPVSEIEPERALQATLKALQAQPIA